MRQFLFLTALFFPVVTWSLTFNIPVTGNNVVGVPQTAQVQAGDTYSAIAERYDVGYYSIFESNPGVDSDNPQPGTILIIPTQYVLPTELHNNIVINLAEMRLYYESDKLHKVFIFPIGIGKEGWVTPTGKFKVMQKVKHPIWLVPESIFKYRQEHGDPLPGRVIQSGPDNPLGTRALRLSQPEYLIHGTDDPVGIGRRSSAGCIRMYNADVEQLFVLAEKGTPVIIINQPYKVGLMDDKVYLEAHMPLYEDREQVDGDYIPIVHTIMEAIDKLQVQPVQASQVLSIVSHHVGVPEELLPG